ncbi:MAG TPA: M24 family metallopeptidase, partial [Tepidiformaceae bacterium]
LVTMDRAILSVDFRYVEQAERESAPRGFEIFRAKGRAKDHFPELVDFSGLSGRRIGVSQADTNLGLWVKLQEAVEEMPRGDRPELVPGPPMIEELRRVKDAEELEHLQKAINIADAAFERVEAAISVGQTEFDLALAVERAVQELGGNGISFETIVACGPWAAMPHASPRRERLEERETIVVDMGARYRGYCSDLTRTFSLGGATEKFEEIYAIVFEAQQNAIERVEAGMSGRQAHELAASVIEKYGYGEQFGHGLGHGVGLEVHESPYLGQTSEDTLEEGMVFTIEPGIYLPGWGGVRIEDVVVLEEGRARVLSHAKKLIPAGV